MLRAAICTVSKALAFVFMLICLCLPARAAHAEISVVRPTSAATVSISSDLEILEDPTGQASLADVMGALHSSFKPAGTDRPAFGISRGAAWTRVAVDLSQDPERASRRAQFSAIHPDTVSFFIVDDAGNVLRTYTGGLDVPRSNTYRKFSVAVGDLGVDHFTLYARMTTHYISTLTQFLVTAQEEVRAEMAVERVMWPLFGAMALAGFFCLLLWAHLREPVYGFGFAVVFSIFITAQSHVNFDRLLWPEALQNGDFTRLVYLGGSGLVHGFGLMFTSYFLDIPNRHPRLHAAARIAALAMVLLMLLVVLVAPYNFFLVTVLNLGVATAFITVMVVSALRAKMRAAITYAVIAAPFITCLLLTNIASYHVLTEHPISISLAVIALTLLVVGITVSLADGFRENLESKVQERTAELSVANEALREAHEAKNRMLGVVAHDLRNPLSGIRAAAQLLIEIPLDQDKRETLLRTIRDGADVTLSMTEDLLDVAAIREGKVELVPDSIDLFHLVESRAELFRMTAQAKDIELRLDLTRIPPAWADAKRAAQVLDNLVSNAVKYSPHEGRVTIELRAIDGRARLSVIDEGQGIPADELDDIFEPFERASPQPTGGERSIGLGLAIVKRLVEAQSGEIRVQSALGKGSRFEMFLPFATTVVRDTPANRGKSRGLAMNANDAPDALSPA
ncbi:MAG: ATP-binding protein [Rhodospirillaceae bacterium]